MAERLIELGNLRIHLKEDEDTVSLLQSLMRHVSNQEIADMLGISERTVRRWKREGRLPSRGSARLKLVDVLEHLTGDTAPGRTAEGTGAAAGAGTTEE
ncbi:MAG: helix-turn-helix domain-containing protein [bacterium]